MRRERLVVTGPKRLPRPIEGKHVAKSLRFLPEDLLFRQRADAYAPVFFRLNKISPEKRLRQPVVTKRSNDRQIAVQVDSGCLTGGRAGTDHKLHYFTAQKAVSWPRAAQHCAAPPERTSARQTQLSDFPDMSYQAAHRSL
jgi:hypothetical protein